MKEKIAIYLVPVESFDTYSLFNAMAAAMMSLTATFWTAYSTAGRGLWVLVAACVFSGLTVIFLALSVWKYFSMRGDAKEYPVETISAPPKRSRRND